MPIWSGVPARPAGQSSIIFRYPSGAWAYQLAKRVEQVGDLVGLQHGQGEE